MHITLTKNMHMKVFFVCLFLFSKIYLYFKKKCQWELWDKNGKKCKKVKKREKYRGLGRYMTIFPLFFFPIFPPLSRLLHFSTAQLRLRQDLGGLSGWKQPKKGVGMRSSTVSPLENPHRRQLFRQLFLATSFSNTDHTIRCARRRSSSFVKAPEGESQSRTGQALLPLASSDAI